MTRRRSLLLGSLVCASLLAVCATASAQAWLPNQGEGSVSVLYQSVLVDRHILSDGSRVDSGKINANGILLDVTYGVTDQIAISLNVPFIAARYVGKSPHFGSVVDDGQYHSSFQDFRFDVRYSATKGPLAITPYLGTIQPSHDYPYWGHAAVGRNLREVQVGAYVARVLDPVIPGGFVQARYGYGFTGRLADVSHNRSLLDVELGYFVNPKLRAFGLAAGQIAHGGIEFTRDFGYALNHPDLWPSLTRIDQERLRRHDQISRTNMLDLGGGVQMSVSPSVDLYGSVVHTVSAVNAHALTYSVSFGATWSFQTKARGRLSDQERHLVKCLCQKGQ